jgi:prepilin-type N-terminal cleavage/methylation domain-containing protein
MDYFGETKMRGNTQQGFTLIELVMVIVILGVLAATALPKFIDLSSDAKTAALTGVTGNISSASAVNYAGRKVRSTNGVAINNCSSSASLLQGGLPTGYSVTAAAIAVDVTVACTVTGPSGTTGTAQVTGIL